MNFLKLYIWKILSILGLLIALISFYYTYIGIKHKSPNYIIKNNNLINENISKIDLLDLKVEGKKINNLTVSKVAFWNSGKETINSVDITETEPITIYVKEGFEILGSPIIIFPTKSPNQFSVKMSVDRRNFNISFNYMDYGDGLIVEVFHTGKDENDIFLAGKIKGVQEIKKITLEKHLEISEYSNLMFTLTLSIVLIISGGFVIYLIISSYKQKQIFDTLFNVSLFILVLFSLVGILHKYFITPSIYSLFVNQLLK